jgi:hypothetical protein
MPPPPSPKIFTSAPSLFLRHTNGLTSYRRVKPSTLLSAFDLFLNDTNNTRTGQCVETAHAELFFYGVPEYKSGDFAKRTEKVYEPWFTYMHGEKSDTEGAILEPPVQTEEAMRPEEEGVSAVMAALAL